MDFILKGKTIVVNAHNDVVRSDDSSTIAVDDVHVVWFSKTLQNWKATFYVGVPNLYYELSYDGEDGVTYVDAYYKFQNIQVRD